MITDDYANMVVLVIDDQSFIRRIVLALLKQMGFKKIFEADDGAGGLKLNGDHNPDLIICDVEMDPIDGLVFLQTLRKSDKTRDLTVPVVFLTQHTNSEIVKKVQALGANAFIVKPPSFDIFKSRIEFALEHAKSSANERISGLAKTG